MFQRCRLPACFFSWVLVAAGLSACSLSPTAPVRPKFYAFCVEAGVPGVEPRPAGEQALLLRRLGFDGLGWSLGWIQAGGPNLEDTIRIVEDAGLELFLLEAQLQVGPDGAAPYPPELPAAIRSLKGRVATVAVTIRGRAPGDPAGRASAVKALRELGDVALEAGVRVSVYNHVDCWAERVPFIIDLVRETAHPQVGFNFNLCHWLKCEGDRDYEPLLREHASSLFCVTISGARIGADTWTEGLIQPLDRGDFDNRRLLATLRDIGYRGPIGLMCYGIPGKAEDHLARSMERWKAWVTELYPR